MNIEVAVMSQVVVEDGPLGRIRVTDELLPALLSPLLRELRDEPCSHSWHALVAGLPASDVFDGFLQIIAHDRPSRVFTYCSDGPQGVEPLAVAVVSERIGHDYPFDGVPVLGRAFVRRQFRRSGVYAATLAHRLRHCTSRWGGALKAIHLGTASEGIERSFRRMHDGPVAHLGNEDLGGAGIVRALMGLSRPFAVSLTQGLPLARREDAAHVCAYLREGPGRVPLRALAEPLARLAQEHDGYLALRELLRHLPTLH